MKYEMHAYGIDYEIENVFKKWNEKIEIHFENWLQNEIESKFSFDFKLNMKMKFTSEIRIFCKMSLVLVGHLTYLLNFLFQ